MGWTCSLLGIGLEMKIFRIFVLFGCVGIAIFSQAGRAQQPQGLQQAPPLEQADPRAATATLPDAYRLNMMIRSSIIALNHANKTGNYTVLLDLASPPFRAANDSSRLRQIFAKLRQRKLDLSPILFYTPKLLQQPQIAPDGMLRLVGYFPTAPERVNFDLYFELVGEEWKIFGIGVEMSPADLTASVAANPQGNQAPAVNNGSERAQSASTGGANENIQARSNQADNSESLQTVAAAAPLPEKRPGNGPKAKTDSDDDETQTAVENRTINNATRIDLSQPDAIAAKQADDNELKKDPAETKSLWESFNLFSED